MIRFGYRSALASLFGVLLLVSACSSADETARPPDDPTSVAEPATVPAIASPAPTSIPTPTEVAVPTGEATVTPVSDAPSQSPADAGRDGIASVVAELTFSQRVEVQGEVGVGGQHWVISKFPRNTIEDLGYEHFSSNGVDPVGGELLHIDGDRIERAISMQGAPPTWIVADGDLLFAGRQGDGGYPSSTVARVHLDSGDLIMLYLPASYANRGWFGDGVWQFVEPWSRDELWSAMSNTLEAQRANSDDLVSAIDALDGAVDRAEIFDPTTVPRLALTDVSPCRFDGYNGGLLYDFGALCLYQFDDPTGTNPMAMVGGVLVPGRLVGAGSVEAAGPIYAAVVEGGMLRLIEANRELNELEVEMPSLLAGTAISQVSFFDGGFVVAHEGTTGDTVLVFDWRERPLVGVPAPASIRFDSSAETRRSNAVVSPDGRTLAFVEQESLVGDADAFQAAVVVADMATGSVVQRVPFEVSARDVVSWLDFDGRWALVSLERHVIEPLSGPAVPFMVDVSSGGIYPLNIDEFGLSTLERPAP